MSTTIDPGRQAVTKGLWRVRQVPIYPVLFAAAWVLSVFTESAASQHALIRPLIVVVVIVASLQLLLSGVGRNRDLGALLALILMTTLLSMVVSVIILFSCLTGMITYGAVKRRRIADLPWRSLTRFFNAVAGIAVVLVVVNGARSGALLPIAERQPTPRGSMTASLPDIYLILLDAHPRADTLAVDFAYDSEPFLNQMRDMGFDVASHSHSNYNLTWLTLASMFNRAHVADLPTVQTASTTLAEFRLLTQAINHGRVLDELEATGYEVVSIPSGFSSATLYSADRVLDSGQMADFEFELMQQGALHGILPDLQASWLIGQHRDRILTTFDQLGALAKERTDHPRFVFAHILSPHPPIAFGPNGDPVDGWPCFPDKCGIYFPGQSLGEVALSATRDQVEFIDRKVVETANLIMSRSERPPVIVFFSDHGYRLDQTDADENLRSFLVASTPGHPGTLPDDVTPINIIPRILNAYSGSRIPLETEESYWVDQLRVVGHGRPLELIPWVVRDP